MASRRIYPMTSALRLTPNAVRQQLIIGLLLLLFTAPTACAADKTLSWHEPIRVATGEAFVGPWRMNESNWHYVDDPTVAINNQGSIGVAWVNQSEQDVYFQRFSPDGEQQFGSSVNVSRSPAIFSWLPKMVITNDDPSHVYILWQEIVFSGGTHGGEAFFARSIDGGRHFSEPINLSNSIAGDGKGRLTQSIWHNGSLDLVKGPAGHIYAAWTEYEGRLWLSRSADSGKNFSKPVHVAGDSKTPARGPSLAVGNDGSVYIAWTVGGDEAADIHFATSRDQGQSFSEPTIINASADHADGPKLTVDSHDTIHLVYGESREDRSGPYHIRYSRSNDQGRSFEESRRIAEARSHHADSINFPYLGLDDRDNLYVAWEIFPNNLNGPSHGIGFTYSDDGGQSFATPLIVPGTSDPALGINGSLQGKLMRKLAVNENGNIIVVNSTFKHEKASHIWLIRGEKN